MKAPVAAGIVLVVALSAGCTDSRWAQVQPGMQESQVRDLLGEPTRVSNDLAPPSIYAPQTPGCGDKAKRVFSYERWSGHALLVYFDSGARVACRETTVITRSH